MFGKNFFSFRKSNNLPVNTSYSRRVLEKNFIIDAVDGKETIAEAGRKELFSFVGRRLLSRKFDKPDVPTEKTEVKVVKVDGVTSFSMAFSVASEISDLNRSVLTQAQVANFCRKYPQVRHKGCLVVFMIKRRRKLYALLVERLNETGDLGIVKRPVDEIYHNKTGLNIFVVIPVIP